jgi:hypothetical protein
VEPRRTYVRQFTLLLTFRTASHAVPATPALLTGRFAADTMR